MYILNAKSKSSRFYSWVWKTDVTKFKTMCPFFWKYLMTIIFLPIVLLFKFLYYLIPEKEKINSSFDGFEKTKIGNTIVNAFRPSSFWDNVNKFLKWVLISVLCLLAVITLSIIVIEFFKNPKKVLIIFGVVILLIGLVFLVAYLFDEHKLGKKISYPFILFGNMIYSLYKNICPIIKWQEND